MSFENLTVETGALGSKSASITNVPEAIVKVIDQSWNSVKDHPDRFCKVNLPSEEDVKEFHLYAKAAARQHDPVLDYRKLPRPGEKATVAYFTLRLLTPDTPRPGRPAAPKNEDNKDK